MKNLFSILFLCFIRVSIHAQAVRKQSDIVCWQENKKLKWGYFQEKSNHLENSNALFLTCAAYSYPEISITPIINSANKGSIAISAYFVKNESWVKDSTDALSFILLLHEQIHFDICELIARKMRCKIAIAFKLGKDVTSPNFRKELRDLLDEEGRLDANYDRETQYGIVASEQKKWASYIKSELDKLSRYKSTASTCR